ncbi:hypothetical protein, partial [Legionella norrlandica]|uniref:hypothetical protein n=1 Tax=Legionella norrlandica TaxID=1498499 RepID=UPI00056B5F2F
MDRQQIIRSFHRIAEHVSNNKIDKDNIDDIFKALENYATQNITQMAYAAQVMELQVNIQEAVRNNDQKQLNRLKGEYNNLVNENPGKPFPWIKESAKVPPFEGNFEQYVEHQQNLSKINKIIAKVDEFLGTNPPEHEVKIARDLKAVLINPKISAENKIATLDKKLQKLPDDPQPKTNLFNKLISLIHNALALSTTKVQIERTIDNSNPPPSANLKRESSFKAFKNTFKEVLKSIKEKGQDVEVEAKNEENS